MDLSGLPTELEQFVQHELQSGRYDSAEAVVSAALRLLQEHKTQGGNGHPSSNSRPAAPYRSALEVRQALSEALTAGKHHLARQLALDGAQQYPRSRTRWLLIMFRDSSRDVCAVSISRSQVSTQIFSLSLNSPGLPETYFSRFVARSSASPARYCI